MSGLQQVNRCPSIGDLQHGLLKAIRWGAVCAALHCHPSVHCASKSEVTSMNPPPHGCAFPNRQSGCTK
jgi:hypothetical protein